jgi:pimeloyl-ACP methyl ester carboxylesterase
MCRLALKSRWCASLLRSPAPIRLQSYQHHPSPADHLMVFLPGIGDILEDYEFYGFIEAARRYGVSADMIVADMHFGYYLRRTMVERLDQDVIMPARKNGYRQIDLVGISLGGFGALYYAMHRPGEIARIFLLAPYLGDEDIVAELARAGSPKKWMPEPGGENDYQRKLWRWLRTYTTGNSNFPTLYLGYGLMDRFAPANQLLAQLIPQTQVRTTPGKHDWSTWMRLWNLLLPEAAGRFSIHQER